MCDDIFDDPIHLGIVLAIAEEMSEEDREIIRIERDLEPFDPDSPDDDYG